MVYSSQSREKLNSKADDDASELLPSGEVHASVNASEVHASVNPSEVHTSGVNASEVMPNKEVMPSEVMQSEGSRHESQYSN